MPILSSDIVFLEASKMVETDDGGGAPTGRVIGDAVSNAIFGDISEQARAGGRVNVKSIFAAVQSLDTAEYLGAHVVLSKPPQDPLVSITLAKAGTFDTRKDIVARLSAYLNAGVEWPGVLLGDHIKGQRTIQIFCRPGTEPPAVGRTLVLQYRYGQANAAEQYVRVTRVSAEVRTFTLITSGNPTDYQAQVVTVDLSDKLVHDFPGSSPSRAFARDVGATILRDTVVADAAEFCGAAVLDAPVTMGDVEARVSTIYSQLVPNSRTESPITDRRPASDSVITLATSPRQVDVAGAPFSQRIRIGQENRGYSFVTILKPLPAPGALRVAFRALGRNYSLTDDGNGRLSGSGSGTVNYLTGSVAVTCDALPDDRSAVVFYWGQRESFTNRAGTVEFRPPEYAVALDHPGVTPGSLTVSWPSGGEIRTATASAAGSLSGDAEGEVNHVQGTLRIRPQYMIDPGGTFSFEYTYSEQRQELISGLSPDAAGRVNFTLQESPAPGTLELMWMVSRVESISSGATSNAATTAKDSAAGVNVLTVPSTRSAVIGWERYSNMGGGLLSGGGGGGGVSSFSSPIYGQESYLATQYQLFEKSGTNSASHTVTTAQKSSGGVAALHSVTDDGQGGLFGTYGTVSYASRFVVLKVVADYSETSFESNYEDAKAFESLNVTGLPSSAWDGSGTPKATQGGGGSQTAKGGQYGSRTFREDFGTAGIVATYKVGSATPTAHVQEFAPPGVALDLCPRTKEMVVPGSLQFTWMGETYSDADGKLYRGRTGSDPGILSGGVDYATGLCGITDYVVGDNPRAITLQSMWTYRNTPSIASVVFNMPTSPSKPASLIFSVVDVRGEQLIASSDLSGALSGDHIRGKADFETGLVEIQFGDYVPDASLTAEQKTEWWYRAADVRLDNGTIWRPWPVDPTTLRYSVVGYSYLPLDAEILGMDPVRLPPDGRVPIFRAGGYNVIGHTGTVGPITVSAGQTISCGRVRLSRIRVVGNDGQSIHNGFTENLDAGTVTFSDVSGYSQPVTIHHRVEDLLVASDVQINGAVRFTRQITHDYPAGSVLSSALMFGDMRASASDVWDQSTWTNVWSDAPIGSPATGTYNDTLAPIVVANADTVPERWALVFTNTTAFYVMGEHVGVIATGSTGADIAPLNPATGRPYFTLRATGWGAGWSAGNVLRFNTDGPIRKIAVIRTTQPGPEPAFVDHEFELLTRGDVDRP